jgi:AraC-like DNA-binding protein
VPENGTYFRPPELPGVEALHASFVEHAYRPHSHPTWTIAVVERGAARFECDDTPQRAQEGELFVLEPEAVHTGMAAVPEGWTYKVLYVEPELLSEWDEADGHAPRAAEWVVFTDPELRERLLRAHAALANGGGLAAEVTVTAAIDALRPHLRPGPRRERSGREHAAVRRARAVLQERWADRVALADLSAAAGLSRFELVRRFRAETGLPPHAYQLDLRVTRAREMLRRGEAPASVAAACGFADQAHLTRTFKRLVGVTPARFAAAA